MSETGRVIDLDWAHIVVGKDEISIIQKEGIEDCPKIRFATKTGNSGGAFSWNRHEPAPGDPYRMVEMILMQGKFGDEQDYSGPMLRIDMNVDGGGSHDGSVQPIFKLSPRQMWSAVPIVAPNLNGGGGGVSGTSLIHPNGRTWLACQGDGNFVLYINLEAYNYGTGFPVWSSGTVMLDESGQPTPQLQQMLNQAGKTFI